MTVEIGSGITGIGENSFRGCNNLTTVTIPASLTEIGERAFMDCTSLVSIVPADNSATLAEYTKCYEGNLRVFTLPSTVTVIGPLAFYNSSFGETTVLNAAFNIPASTGNIEAQAFYGIPATHVCMFTSGLSVCEIGEKAFGNCAFLHYFEIVDGGANVSYIIADNAFAGCTDLVFIGTNNADLQQYARDHGFTYLENETTAVGR